MAWLFDTSIFSVVGDDSVIIPGATLSFYVTGTSTPLATYTDSALVTPNSNPVVAAADARFPAIWMQEASYKVILKHSDGTTLITVPLARNPAIGNDSSGLRADLASTASGKGASLVGVEGGGTLQDIATLVESLDDTSGTQGAQRIGYKSPLTGASASTVYAAIKSRRATAEGDFGVVFDNSTVNTTALQTALDALSTAGGGTLELSAGVAVTGTLNRPAGVHIVGQGPYQTRLKATSGLNAALVQAIGTSGAGVLNRGGVSNLAIVGSGLANTSMTGIKEAWTNRSVMRDVHFHGCYIGYYFSNVWQVVLDQLHAHGGGAEQNAIGFWGAEVDPSNQNNAVIATGCVAQDVSLYGYRLINANGSKFTSCEAGGGTYGFYCANPTTGTEAFRWAHFVNCLADTNTSHNWYFEKGSATSVKQFQLSNCWGGTSSTGHNFYFSGVSEMAMSNALAIASYLSSVRFNNSSRCRLSNSVLRDWNGAVGANPGIAVDNSTVIGITGNEIYTATPGTGKAVIMTGTSDYATIVGNNLGASYTSIGANNQIANNTVI